MALPQKKLTLLKHPKITFSYELTPMFKGVVSFCGNMGKLCGGKCR